MGEAILDYLHGNPEKDDCIELIVYHAQYPSNNDPFYVACKKDQDALHDFYFPDFLPQAYFNGQIVNWDEKKSKLDSLINVSFNDAHNDTSVAAGMFFSNVIQDENGISGVLNIIRHSSFTAATSNPALHVALIDDYIEEPSAPGTNGQRVFHSIFRGFANDGYHLSIPNGDSLRVAFTMDITLWSDDLRIVAFLQDISESKKIHQTISYKI